MYSRVFVPVDNSSCSWHAADIAIALAQRTGASVTGCHVYAARLHDARFRQMESGLPPRYQEEGELQRQRQVHDSLITRGLQLISDSYMDVFSEKCKQAGVPYNRRVIEGTNYVELVKEAETGGYDLVVIGSQGLGAVEGSLIGSVCERVARKARPDVLVVKNGEPLDRCITVAVDGSARARAGLGKALALARAFDVSVEAVSVFDPYFHIVAFHSLAGVLSEEASSTFRFREQERLHDEVIHKGLEKLYRGHLEEAAAIGENEGMDIKTSLLSGKPFQQILKYIRENRPSLLVAGRFGAHYTGGLDIGGTAENLLRLSPCHVLITDGEAPTPEAAPSGPAETTAFPWSAEAESRLEKVPPFARDMARRAIEDYARSHGYSEVTPELMSEAREKMGM